MTVASKPSSLIGGVGEEEEVVVGGVLPTPSILELELQGKQYLGSCRDLQVRPENTDNGSGWRTGWANEYLGDSCKVGEVETCTVYVWRTKKLDCID